MKRKTFIILLVAAVLLGGAIGGAFIGGMAIGKTQGRTEVTQGSPRWSGQLTAPSTQTNPQGGVLFGRGGTIGTVASIEGNTVTLTAPDGTTVRILISDSTTIQKMDEGSLDDLSPGESISVSGERGEDGSITATSIFITPGFGAQ